MLDSRKPQQMYFMVFAGLIALTALTVGLSYLDLGEMHAATGIAIAVAKAVLIVLFFMHVIQSDRATWLVAIASLFWLGILLAMTMTDYLGRYPPM